MKTLMLKDVRAVLRPCRRIARAGASSVLAAVLLVAPVTAAAGISASDAGSAAAAGKQADTDRENGAARSADSPVEVRELWTGALYTSTYRVGVCFSSLGDVRGVVHLKLRNGEVDVYHIIGEVRNNEIRARHSSGHTFRGRLVSGDSVEGVISLKNGMQVRLEGRREHDAQLADEDCAPLP